MTRISIFILLVLCTSHLRAETVRVAQFGKSKFLLYLPLYLADEEGYFRQEGIEISYSFSGNDDQTFATLASNSADIAVGDPIFTAIAAERGFQARTIALMVHKLAVFGYTKNKQLRAITDPNDLSSLRVGSFPSPSTTFTLLSQINRRITGKPMQIVEGVQGTQLAMLNAGLLDIAIDLEPTVSIAEAQGMPVIFNLAELTESQAITGINVRASLISSKPQMLQGFVRALARALSSLQHDRKPAYKTAATLFPELSGSVIQRAVDRLLDSDCFPPSPKIEEQQWQRSLATRLAAGDLQRPQRTEIAVDNRFAQAAAPMHQ